MQSTAKPFAHSAMQERQSQSVVPQSLSGGPGAGTGKNISVVHRCFRVLEITQKIMAHIDADEDCGPRALVALSKTARLFYDVAQDVLWRHQDGLSPLLMCMPQEVWDREIMVEQAIFCFVRPPLLPDWTRFLANATRVRSLIYDAQSSDVDEDVWGMIALYRPAVMRLLPRLRKLVWRDSSDGYAFVNLLLGPSVTDLTLGRRWPDEAFVSVLSAIPHTCPNLENLRLVDHLASFPLEDNIALPLLKSLEKLRLYHADRMRISGSAFHQLAKKRFLREAKLAITENCLLSIASQLSRYDCFPSIRCLHLQLDQLDINSLTLLHAITSSSLRDLALSSANPKKTTLINHLQVLLERPNSQKLRSLSLTFPSIRDSSLVPDRPECTLDLKALEHVLSFRNLLHLSITSAYLEVNDATVGQLAKTFPRLKTMRLLSNYHTGRSPLVTPDGICTVSQQCRHLEELGLAFDTSLTASWNMPVNTGYNEALRVFDVGESPIVQPGPVALFITLLFANPTLKITADPNGTVENRPLRQQYATLWREVQQQIAYMAMARQQERLRMEQRFRSQLLGAETTTPEPEDSDIEDVLNALL